MNFKWQQIMVCFCLLNATYSYAASELSLSKFLQLAKQNDPKFQKILKDNLKLDYIVDQGLPTREFTVAVENEHGIDSIGSSDTSVLTTSISKDIIETGTSVSASYTKTDRVDRKEKVTEFRLEQDLLKNFFGRNIRLKKESLLEQQQIASLEVQEAQEEYLVEIIGVFLDYNKAYLDSKLAKQVLADSKRLQANVAQKRKNKIATSTDVDRSVLQTLLREEDLLAKEKELDLQRERVRAIIGDTLTKQPVNDLEQALPFNFAKTQNLDSLRKLQISRLTQNTSAKSLSLAQRESTPSLSLLGGYDIDNSSRFSSTVDRKEYVIGFRFEMPLWDTVNSANRKMAALNFVKSELDVEIAKRTLQIQMESLRQELKEKKQRLQLVKQKVTVAKRILSEESKRYRYGKLSLDDLIDFEADVVQYQFELQTENLNYQKALLSWAALNDQIIR